MQAVMDEWMYVLNIHVFPLMVFSIDAVLVHDDINLLSLIYHSSTMNQVAS